MNDPADIRAQVVDFLQRELVGPDPRPEHQSFNEGDEVLRPQDPPRLRYSAGVLFPGGATVAEQEIASETEVEASTPPVPEAENVPETDEAEEETLGEASSPGSAADPDEATEHEVNRANEFLPSAMGLSALIRLPRTLKVTVRAAHYEKRTVANLGRQAKDGNWQPHHFRRALTPPPVEIDCALFNAAKPVVHDFKVDLSGLPQKLSLHVFSRPYVDAEQPGHDRIITFTLINRTDLSGDTPKDSECFFQCGFTVEPADGAACFLEYPDRAGTASNDEAASLRLLYRHRRTFAVGHGCAADWGQEDPSGAALIRTDTLPTYDVKPILPREIPGLPLSMLELSAQEGIAPVEACRRLVAEYGQWIGAQKKIVEGAGFPGEHREAAQRHLKLCGDCLLRIKDGVDLLASDPDTRRAFAWMNEAMLLQQLHYDVSTKRRRTWTGEEGQLTLPPFERPDTANPPKNKGLWRPFQLAFILMNLRSIAQRESEERKVVDLIWFPTGGGKTEAYLGLTAFTIFRRRLANLNDAGTTVLMRYTLRLLTTQQFQRAASLICACEIIRRPNEPALGRVRISAGLWVGGSVTPNDNDDASAALNKLAKSGSPNPFIVLTCPWCGAEMGPVRTGSHYKVKGYRREAGKVVFRCEDAKCDFHDTRGLPLVVVDEAIYDERPTLVIGTVDKFAMLPWLTEAKGRRLFGLDTLAPVSPPDLIIQDELHLISGALGSMVGMYESTINALCQHQVGGKSVPAKIVASTATICRAEEQVHSLYARDVFLFPPQGLRAGDSFFAEESLMDPEGRPRPGRLYVGVFGTALSSHVTAQIRVMAALLQAVKCIKAPTPGALDPYWTLMAYFNSLRELGHAATLIRADIREYLNAVWDRLEIRKPKPDSGQPDLRRFINRDLELTSRIQSSQITEVLQQLFNHYPPTDQQRPVDVCLATNMIQVGLDVPRLGLMTVVGQPKTTAEYIQATSRVGRDASGPGLVVTVYNTGKPRDRSHFEHFHAYHQSIYRWVEPTSVTPFAIPVRERAMHAQLITLLRYWGPAALRDSPRPAPSEALYQRVREVLIDRVKAVDQGEVESAGVMLDKLMAVWRTILPPKYGQFGPPPVETPLMYPSGTEPRAAWATRAKSTPSSMRNVDAGCDASVIPHFPQP